MTKPGRRITYGTAPATIARSASRLLRLNGVRSSRRYPVSKYAPAARACRAIQGQPTSRSTKTRCLGTAAVSVLQHTDTIEDNIDFILCNNLSSTLISTKEHSIPVLPKMDVCAELNRRAIAKTGKPSCKSKRAVASPIRPEAPNTAIVGKGFVMGAYSEGFAIISQMISRTEPKPGQPKTSHTRNSRS